jgi:hypothetical protein
MPDVAASIGILRLEAKEETLWVRMVDDVAMPLFFAA